MATASSTAAPKLMVSPRSPPTGAPEKKITLHSTSVSTKSAAMATLLMTPRFVMPTRIHTTMRPPMTRHHIQCPPSKIPPMARAPS